MNKWTIPLQQMQGGQQNKLPWMGPQPGGQDQNRLPWMGPQPGGGQDTGYTQPVMPRPGGQMQPPPMGSPVQYPPIRNDMRPGMRPPRAQMRPVGGGQSQRPQWGRPQGFQGLPPDAQYDYMIRALGVR